MNRSLHALNWQLQANMLTLKRQSLLWNEHAQGVFAESWHSMLFLLQALRAGKGWVINQLPAAGSQHLMQGFW